MPPSLFCCVPARLGSKRLPRKNLLPLAGRPLLAHTITTARESGLFDAVFVCTESAEIADAARARGATAPVLLPPELCGDLVASHVPCQNLAGSLGRADDVLVCLQPTSPLRSVDDIHAAVERFRRDDLDFLVSITPIDPHYFHWAVRSGADGWGMYFGNQYLIERPLLPSVHRPNGAIKIARLGRLREVGHFFGPRLGVVEMPEERSVHVATQFDFDLCEFLLRRSAA